MRWAVAPGPCFRHIRSPHPYLWALPLVLKLGSYRDCLPAGCSPTVNKDAYEKPQCHQHPSSTVSSSDHSPHPPHKRRRDQDGKEGHWSSLSTTNTSKTQQHVELSLKTNKTGRKTLLHKDCKNPHRVSKEGRRSDQVSTCNPRMGHRRWERYPGLGDPPWGMKDSNHIFDTLALGSNTRKTSALTWFENQYYLQDSSKKLRLHSWRTRAHTCLLLGTRQRKQMETSQGSGQFLKRAPLCQATPMACSNISCSSAASPLGWSCPFQEGGEFTLRGNGTSSDPTIRVSAPAP